jgi:hypothetical protein
MISKTVIDIIIIIMDIYVIKKAHKLLCYIVSVK